MHNTSKHAESCMGVPFWCPTDGWPRLGGQISQNGQNDFKLARSSLLELTEDEWRHRRITSLSSFVVHRCLVATNFRCFTANRANRTIIYCQIDIKMQNAYSHPNWRKDSTYALVCTFSFINLVIVISAVIILWFIFWQFCTNYTLKLGAIRTQHGSK